eukprot:PITA_20547
MLGQMICPKYLDRGSPAVDVHINGTIIPHTLIDLGVAINVMTRDTMLKLNLQSYLRKNSIVLQLADRSTVTPEGIVEDILVSVDSWEYPTDFLVLQPKEKLTSYLLILGRPWLATADAYISCGVGSMTIKNGPMSKQLVLYPPAQPLLENDLPLWLEEGDEDEVYSAPLCTVEATRGGPQTEDDLIENLIQNPPPGALSLVELVEDTQASALVDLCVTDPTSPRVKSVEFSPERTLKISSSLSPSQEKELCSLLNNHLDAFAWSYREMKGVHPSVCTHHIYIKEDCKLVRQPQRRMNPALKDIVKEELQKLLDARFIYPISDMEIYMDDFTPYGSNFQEALTNLGKVLTKCIEMNLSLSPEKCEFLMTEGTVLSHTISQQGLQVDPNNIAIIQKVPPPQKIIDVQSFLGLAGYYRRFIKDFSKLASPLFSLLGKDVEFKWTDDCRGALDELKDKLVSTPILMP